MLVRLMELEHKPIKQIVTAYGVKRGAPDPVLGEEYLVDVQKNYNGANAAIEPNETDFEFIDAGEHYNCIPTFLGERYATTEVEATGLSDGAGLTANNGKFVAGSGLWVYHGEYTNPYGVKMYIIERSKIEPQGM